MTPSSWTPRRALTLLAATQIVLWTAVPLLTNSAMPLDVVREGLAWGVAWQWGYYKHPPLATWLVDAAFRLAGDLGPYLLAQAAVTATYLFVFLFGRALFGATKAAAGTLLLAGLYYFSWPSPEFNHNVAQMPLWAAAAYLFHRAVRSDRLVWWLLLGAALAAGLLVKYATAILVGAMAIYVLGSRVTWPLLRSPRLYAGAALSVCLLLPHLVWLAGNDFAPLRYFDERAQPRGSALAAHLVEPIRFLLAQAVDHLPILLLLAAAGLLRRPAPSGDAPALAREDRRLLLTLSLAPALLGALAALIGGIGLRDMWGAPMFNLSGLLIVSWLAPRAAAIDLRRLSFAAAGLLAAIALAYGIRSLYGAALTGRPQRVDWPSREIARSLEDAWHARTGCPLRVVAGDSWLAGLVSMRASTRPVVLLEGDPSLSPWITPARLAREGVLLVWRIETNGDNAVPPPLARLGAAEPGEPRVFSWPRASRIAPLRIGWAALPPSDPTGMGCTPPS